MKQATTITNYSEEDFTHSWDSVAYSFPAGQSQMMESSLTFHFARHLAIRELNKRNVITSKLNIKNEMKKAMGGETIEAEDTTKLQVEALNYNGFKKTELVEEAEEKGIKTKGKKKKELVDELENFEGK